MVARVIENGDVSEPFPVSNGVKQGCVLSPHFFKLFLADLPEIFDDTCHPAELNAKPIHCLMYADDLALLSLSKEGLQNGLDKLSIYCSKWNLTINTAKTQIIIFNKSGHIFRDLNFNINGRPLEVVKEYPYLGIVFEN